MFLFFSPFDVAAVIQNLIYQVLIITLSCSENDILKRYCVIETPQNELIYPKGTGNIICTMMKYDEHFRAATHARHTSCSEDK